MCIVVVLCDVYCEAKLLKMKTDLYYINQDKKMNLCRKAHDMC